MADDVVSAIKTAAGTGKIGDGKIFVLSLEDAMRIEPLKPAQTRLITLKYL